MPLSSKTTQTNVQNHLRPGWQADRRINRRTLLKGVGGLAAASFVGGGAVVAGSAPAQAALNVAQHEDSGRMQYYKLVTPSIGWLPRVNVLLPDGYDATRRYPVLYLLHGGGEDYSTFDTKYDIRNHTAGRDLIVVMPDGGAAGWYCDPESSNVGPRNWETFHVGELIPLGRRHLQHHCPALRARRLRLLHGRFRGPEVRREASRALRVGLLPLGAGRPAHPGRRGGPLGELHRRSH